MAAGSSPLSASFAPAAEAPADAYAIVLRVVNASDGDVDVLNPDMGRPSDAVPWPYGLSAYRMSLLLSFGFLTVEVADGYGEEVAERPLETWATPVLSAPLRLAPGEAFDLHLPLGAFYPLRAGERYRLSVAYGDRNARVRAEGEIAVPSA